MVAACEVLHMATSDWDKFKKLIIELSKVRRKRWEGYE